VGLNGCYGTSVTFAIIVGLNGCYGTSVTFAIIVGLRSCFVPWVVCHQWFYTP
jgi:hypothetical protein